MNNVMKEHREKMLALKKELYDTADPQMKAYLDLKAKYDALQDELQALFKEMFEEVGTKREMQHKDYIQLSHNMATCKVGDSFQGAIFVFRRVK